MKKILSVLFIAFVFSGCFDIYIYLIPLKDNSYIVSQRVSFGLDVLKGLNSLSTMDSTGQTTQKEMPTPKQMMDSIMAGESKKNNDFEKLPGYLSHSMRDSLSDTTAFFITDIHIKSADDLPALFKTIQSDSSSPADLSIALNVSHPDGMTRFDFAAIKNNVAPENNANVVDMAKLVIGGFHIGVISDRLIPNATKTPRKEISGGSEWFIPFKSLKDWAKVKPKNMQFLVRD